MAEVLLSIGVETLLSFAVEKLWDLLVRETGRLQGVEEQFNGLKSDLTTLRCFLEDADAKKHTSAMVRNTIKETKEIVWDAEDIVETFLRKEELEKTSGFRNRVKRFCAFARRRGLASDMEAISKRISKVIRDMQTLGVQRAIVDDEYMRSLKEKQRELRHAFANDKETVLVGLEENVKKLVGYLVDEGSSSQVVSITGMGGIGKTTLARQVFNHETIKSHFGGLAWVCVSQQFTREYVWGTILRKLMPECKVSEMTIDELQEKLFQVLGTQKALIVIDDIWREEDWDLIEPMFPRKRGCKLLLTSRNEGVALRADPRCFTFKPDPLTPEESWTLFRRIAFPSETNTEYKVDEEMEKVGKEMIKHCCGLPLAVKVLGGLLPAQSAFHEWKRVYENLKPHIVGGISFDEKSIDSVHHLLSLSFEELPSYLKYCFLYLAHFPEDYEIKVEDLANYWAGEGILRFKDGDTIRNVGDRCVEELVRRNMVIAERDNTTLRFETCRLHDLMREMCLSKAKEENFVQIIGVHSPTPTAEAQSISTSRRVVSHDRTTLHVQREINNLKVRSLVVVKKKDFWGENWELSSLSFTRLQLLRVLDLRKARFEGWNGWKLPDSIGKLIHLRYLNLEDARLSHLPSSLQNLKLLIYLNLRVEGGRRIHMHDFLKGMKELRYLALPYDMRKKTKLEMSHLVNLETLINFSTENCSLEDLQGMTRLKTLGIRVTGETSLVTISASIGGWRHMENLDISYRGAEGTKEWRNLLEFPNLKQLGMEIYIPLLSDGLQFPSLLTSITLEECGLEEDPMPILEQLLQLKEVYLWYESFCGRRMVCSAGGFPQLQKLSFCDLKEWEEWIVEKGSMPFLHTLEINHCEELKEFPARLRFITSLKDLKISHMGKEWDERAPKGEDYYKGPVLFRAAATSDGDKNKCKTE